MMPTSSARFMFTPHNPTIHNPGIKSIYKSDWLFSRSFFDRAFDIISAVKNSSLSVFRDAKLISFRNDILNPLRKELQKIPYTLKGHSVLIVKTCTQQCECVAAHRIRRGVQIFNLYNKLWEERALKELGRQMRQRLVRKGKELIIGAVGISVYNWDNERISDQEIAEHFQDLDQIYNLRENTITCRKCQLRQIVDVAIPNVMYCQCPGTKELTSSEGKKKWSPFIERQDLIIWRREHEKHPGLFIYKVYGTYNDVTANNFLQCQLDTEYRKKWDSTVADIRVVDSDPKTNSDVVYWEMKWPRLFSNRDYCFGRRYVIDYEKKQMLIINKGTEHPKCPVRTDTHRVQEYWSYMVIKPYHEFHEPGIEFGLTYFDNPGVSVPSSVSGWVTMSGLPDFLQKLREAARKLPAIKQTSHKQRDIDENRRKSPKNPEETAPSSPVNSEDGGHSGSYFEPFHADRLFL